VSTRLPVFNCSTDYTRFLTGTLLQVVILENNPNYLFPAWHGSLFVIACILLVGCINVFGAKLIPKLQNFIFGLHVLACAQTSGSW